MEPNSSTRPRQILQRFPAANTRDGEGVSIRRSIAQLGAATLDPFLMLDEFHHQASDGPVAGFPPHPHRGFETVTYMLEGSMFHEDNMGNAGEIEAGGVQWMTAGRGVIHAETPSLSSQGRLHGFQLWVNLPASKKMCAPQYREFDASALPTHSLDDIGSKAVVIAGQLTLSQNGAAVTLTGPIEQTDTHTDYADLRIAAHSRLQLNIPSSKRVLLYVYDGSVSVDNTPVEQHCLAILSDGDLLQLETEQQTSIILLAATPLNEAVVQWGPFVMNSRDEIEQAIRDFREGRLTD